MVLPLLAMGAAAYPSWRPALVLVSVIFALNLNVFYGLGEGIGLAVPRTLTVIDATVWLSLANTFVFVQMTRRLSVVLQRDADHTAAKRDSGRSPSQQGPHIPSIDLDGGPGHVAGAV
jgi:hypothetical protein